VTRPRKPFGSSHPGRLPATMMKVLAAEMTDPTRLRRGKQYAKDGSVLDIVIDPGTVTCEIQGSRSTPYIAVLAVRPGDGMPLRRDVEFTCTCPDDDNWDGHACKHVVATLFTFSDELLLEPGLLDLWRGREPRPDADDHTADDRDDGDHTSDDRDDDRVEQSPRRRGHLRLVGAGETGPEPATSHERTPVDALAHLLAVPDGVELPAIASLDRIEPELPPSPDLARVLRDAIGQIRLDWD